MPSITYEPPRRRPLNPLHCQLFLATTIFVFSHCITTSTAIADQQLPAHATDKQILSGELDPVHRGPQSQQQIRPQAPATGHPYANQRPRLTNIGADDRPLLSVGERYPKGSLTSLDQPSESLNLQTSHNRANTRPPPMPASSSDAHLPSYSSHQQNFSATSLNNPDVDHIFEGSGDGPARKAKDKAKFDDTEEGDDDDDDDYDYRDTLDSGSGQGNDQVADRKKVVQPSVVHANDQLQRPTESDPYLPFRQPTAVGSGSYAQSTTQPPRTTPSYLTLAPTTTTIMSIEATQPEVSSVKNNMATLPQLVIPPANDSVPIEVLRQTVSSTASPPRMVTAPSKLLPNHAQETTERPRQVVLASMTTTLPPSSNNQLMSPTHSVGLSSSIVPISIKLPHSNGSSLSRPSLSKNGDQDYDYSDENEDDDSEDQTNFEDSEPVDGGFINKTISVSNSTTPVPGFPPRTVPTTPRPPMPTTQAYVTTRPITTSIFPSPPTQRPQSVFDHTNRDVPSKPFASVTTTSTTRSPLAPPVPINQPEEGGSNDDEDDDEEDDEEEEEEAIEEDVGKSDPDDEDDEPLPAINRPPAEYPPEQPAPPSRSQGRPVGEFNGGSHRPLKDILLQPHLTENATPSSGIPYRPDNPFGHPPLPPINTRLPIATRPSTTMTAIASTTTSTTTTTTTTPSTTTFRSVTTARPFVYTMSGSPTSPSAYFPSSTRQTVFGYSTTPGDQAVPSITRTSNILGYGRGSPGEDDTDLTRQIYDKAVEVYQATNKAVAAAIEAVWPPTFELNSSTFEPLLAQPMLFMLALGGAVMGLVLVMMLLVYLITYQIQPKDDISIY